MERVEIAIIGGGLVGISLALALQAYARQRGWRILLIEPFPLGNPYQPSYDARSTALSFGTQRIYKDLGLWPSIALQAEAITQIQVSERGRLGATRLLAQEERVPALGYVVENAWLGQCLWQALDPEIVAWRCPAQVTELVAHTNGYRLTLSDGATLTCALAVLADGGRSGLRAQLGIHVKTTPYQQSALVANVSVDQTHRGRAFERFTSEGPLALLPLPQERYALVWTCATSRAESLEGVPAQDFLAQLQEVFGYRLGAFHTLGTRHLYPLELVEATEQIRPHLVLLGNAAHSLHPIAGQGYNLSLRDVLCLVETLAEQSAPLGDFAVLQGYIAKQQQDQARTVAFSDRVTRLFSNNQPALAAGRTLGLLGLDLLPPAKRWFARQAMGLGVRTQ